MTPMPGETRDELERRLSELSAQVRHYPTPIARCDEHLAALLESRSQVLAQIRRIDQTRPSAGGCTASAI